MKERKLNFLSQTLSFVQLEFKPRDFCLRQQFHPSGVSLPHYPFSGYIRLQIKVIDCLSSPADERRPTPP